MKYSEGSDDRLVATSDWLYMTLRRLGRKAEADDAAEADHAGAMVIENASYWNRLLMYKGRKTPEELLGGAIGGSTLAEGVQLATQGYGVGNWYLVQRREGQGARGVREDAERRLVGRLRLHRGGSGPEARILNRRLRRRS